MSHAHSGRAHAHDPHAHLEHLMRVSDEVERKLQRLYERERTHMPRLPDLRFEYSYTRSVAPYVRLERADGGTGKGKGKERAVDSEEETQWTEPGTEVVQVQWGRVLWISARDQILSPLLQGIVWGVAGYYLRPLGALLGARIGRWWTKGGRRGKLEQDGHGVQWLRNLMGSLVGGGLISNTAGAVHLK